jgi:hypothetical protein
MKKYFFSFLAFLIIAACNKDKFQTKPTLKITSDNPKTIPVGGTLSVTLEYTDKEGDVNDSLFIIRQRLNVRGRSTYVALPYKIPDFPATDKGEIRVNLDYQLGLTLQIQPIRIPGSNPSRNEPDTLNLKFVVKDKAKNISDTVVLNNVIVSR